MNALELSDELKTLTDKRGNMPLMYYDAEKKLYRYVAPCYGELPNALVKARSESDPPLTIEFTVSETYSDVYRAMRFIYALLAKHGKGTMPAMLRLESKSERTYLITDVGVETQNWTDAVGWERCTLLGIAKPTE